MKGDSASTYVHMRCDNPSSCTHLYAFCMTLHSQPVAYVLDDGPFLNRKHIKTFEYHIQWKINIQKNKFLNEKINGSVEWNTH